MQFVLTSGWEDGVADLTKRLVTELRAGKKVLWLLSGGSNVKVSVRIMENIADELTERLCIGMIDERYGYVGHENSNWEQLLKAGLEPRHASVLTVLHSGDSFEATIDKYEAQMRQAFAAADVVIGQIGIGKDGHLAGILPNTIATSETDNFVVGYNHEPYQRLSLSFSALSKIDAAYCFTFGDEKYTALKQLHDQEIDRKQQPAQILKTLPEAYIYNDQIGEHP